MVTTGRGDRTGAVRCVRWAGWLLVAVGLPLTVAAEAGTIDDPKDPMYWKPPKEKPALREVLSVDVYEKRFAEALKKLDLPTLEKSREPDRATRVTGVTRGGTADRLGIVVGDFILELDGTPITDPRQFNALRKNQLQLLVWQTAAAERQEGEIPLGRIEIQTAIHDRPELRYLRGKGRNSRWDREMVVALVRCGEDPDLAETCLARAVSAGYAGGMLDRTALEIAFAQACYDAVMDRAWLMLQADPKDCDVALLFASAATFSYKLPAARQMLEQFPDLEGFMSPGRAMLDRLIEEHLTLPANRRVAPPPSETAQRKLRDDLLLRAQFYGPAEANSLPKHPFESHAMTSYPGEDRGMMMIFGPAVENLEIRLDFSLRNRTAKQTGMTKTFGVVVNSQDEDDTNPQIKAHHVLWIQFTVWHKVYLRHMDKLIYTYDESRCPAPQAGFDPEFDNALRIIADAGRLEAFLNGRRIFYGPLPQGRRDLFQEYFLNNAELCAKRFEAFELVDPEDAKSPAFRDINKAYLGGQTRLHRAVDVGPAEDIPRWLAHGADPNAKDGQGMTPLMIAALRGRSDVVTSLLAKGADTGATDKKGKTAIDHAKANGKNAVVELFQNRADAPK